MYDNIYIYIDRQIHRQIDRQIQIQIYIPMAQMALTFSFFKPYRRQIYTSIRTHTQQYEDTHIVVYAHIQQYKDTCSSTRTHSSMRTHIQQHEDTYSSMRPMCPHTRTAVYVSSYSHCYVCVLILALLYSVLILALLYMCPHTRTTMYVSSYYTSPHTTVSTQVSWYTYDLILLFSQLYVPKL